MSHLKGLSTVMNERSVASVNGSVNARNWGQQIRWAHPLCSFALMNGINPVSGRGVRRALRHGRHVIAVLRFATGRCLEQFDFLLEEDAVHAREEVDGRGHRLRGRWLELHLVHGSCQVRCQRGRCKLNVADRVNIPRYSIPRAH
eukprot:1045185-Prorocentrum_minimum.AAC.2